MKKLMTLLLLIAALPTLLSAQGQSGSIQGTVVDENGEPAISATIQVIQDGIVKNGNVTDFDGNYVIKPLAPGRYELSIKLIGYMEHLVKDILVAPGKPTEVNAKLTPKKTSLQEVVIQSKWEPQLIDKFGSGANPIKTSEEIERMPTRNTTSIAQTQPGVYSKGNGVNISSARGNGMLYIIDGVQVVGGRGINLPQGAIDQMQITTSGTSAKHGDATGQVYKYQSPMIDKSPPVSNNKKQPVYLNPSKETYKKEVENDFMNVATNPLSTLSIDVDRASYSNIRRFINNGQIPPADAVRIEEMVNYFHYDYPEPEGTDPIAIVTELTECPWNKKHKLLHIGMQAQKMDIADLPPSNLVFLIDVSGSMGEYNKLPLVKQSLKLLVQNLREEDRIAIVVYAGNAGLVLPSTKGSDKRTIISALDALESGGSTAGGAGIQLAYKTALDNFIKKGNNRVILATDGDFNVGVSGDNELEDLITGEREKGVFLTCLGYGMGNYKDSKLEILADKGNGNYAYIDNLNEAKKTLVNEFGGTIFTVAKDVKTQVEFNPAVVQGYRLVGYENRLLNAEDFRDDKKDAGEMGAGHSVTMIYEIIPAGQSSKDIREVDELKYQHKHFLTYESELATIRFRYKNPDADKSKQLMHIVKNSEQKLEDAHSNVQFATSVAMFGMMLKDSKYKNRATYDKILSLASENIGADKEGYRAEFLALVKTVRKRAGRVRN